MMSRYLYVEDLGREQFYIAEVEGAVKFVWLDKYGIANIFSEMAELVKYIHSDLNDCARQCIEPYETGIEGVDFIDDYLGIEG